MVTTQVTTQMAFVKMPSNDKMITAHYDPVYLLSPAGVEMYKSVPVYFKKQFDRFGNGDTAPPPGLLDVNIPLPGQLAGAGDTLTSYKQLVSNMSAAVKQLQTAEAELLKWLKTSADIAEQGRQDINRCIEEMNSYAVQAPADPTTMTENMWVMQFIAASLQNLADTMTSYAGQFGAQADGAPKIPAVSTGDPTGGANSGVPKVPGPASGSPTDPSGSPTIPSGSPTDPSGSPADPNGWQASAPPPIDPNGTTGPTPGSTPGPTPATDPTGANNGTAQQLDDLANKLNAIPSNAPMTTPSAGGLGDLSSLPMMMDMLRGQQGLGDTPGDQLGNGQYEPSPPPVTPTPAQTSPAATPPPVTSTSGSPSTSPAAQQAAPVDKATTSTQPTAQPMAHQPDADGSVTYTFPDGVTQKVSAVVAQALDAAFSNHGDTDAQGAYAKTSAKWSDNKQIGDRVDPSQLMTGDVAIFHDPEHTAIVRVMGSLTDGTVDVIVRGNLMRFGDDGQLKPLSGDGQTAPTSPTQPVPPDGAQSSLPSDTSPDAAGDIGTFAGFMHPHGIEMTSAASKPGDPMAAGIDPNATQVSMAAASTS
ncbi:hypothetical protein [Nocardia sp. NBC_00511]|uniref:hypothetical protein n=1 Tax=Nocardia sp. NBC_00511 TaxID=2903591 RepID=UPI002F91A079